MPESAYEAVVQSLWQLVARLTEFSVLDQTFGAVESRLNSLPIASDEVQVLLRRLHSAKQYARLGDRVAARWELQLLVHCLGGPR